LVYLTPDDGQSPKIRFD